MKTNIKLIEHDLRTEGAFVLQVLVGNDESTERMVPLERIASNAELILEWCEQDGARLEPLEYKLVSPAQDLADRVLLPGETHAFELRGRFLEKAPDVFALVFPRATYRLVRGGRYSLSFGLGDFKSEAIEITM